VRDIIGRTQPFRQNGNWWWELGLPVRLRNKIPNLPMEKMQSLGGGGGVSKREVQNHAALTFYMKGIIHYPLRLCFSKTNSQPNILCFWKVYISTFSKRSKFLAGNVNFAWWQCAFLYNTWGEATFRQQTNTSTGASNVLAWLGERVSFRINWRSLEQPDHRIERTFRKRFTCITETLQCVCKVTRRTL
jgi:hypothetical protein